MRILVDDAGERLIGCENGRRKPYFFDSNLRGGIFQGFFPARSGGSREGWRSARLRATRVVPLSPPDATLRAP